MTGKLIGNWEQEGKLPLVMNLVVLPSVLKMSALSTEVSGIHTGSLQGYVRGESCVRGSYWKSIISGNITSPYCVGNLLRSEKASSKLVVFYFGYIK